MPKSLKRNIPKCVRGYLIDGGAYFINHSCNPSVFLHTVFHEDKRLPVDGLDQKQVIIKPRHNISKGSQLCFDYYAGRRFSKEEFDCLCGERCCKLNNVHSFDETIYQGPRKRVTVERFAFD